MAGIAAGELSNPSNDREPRPPTDAPLIVLCSFLSRADASPLAERRRSPGHMLDRNGDVIADPAAEPAANGFEGDPNINFEKWSEYWRKVHGPRFLYMEDASDRSFERLRRYDQLHRLPAGPTSFHAPPYAAPVDAEGKLYPTVIGHVGPYRRPQSDGIAYLAFETVDDIGVVLGSERVRTKILPEDRAIFREIAPLLSRQYVLMPGTGRDAIALVQIHIRRPDLDRAEFQRRWLNEHADLVLAQEETRRLATRYVQLHNIGGSAAGAPFFHEETSSIDGVSLTGFSAAGDAEEFLQSDGYRMIAQGERAITSADKGEYWTAVTFGVLDRSQPERASRR
jgi:hypothetical protein